MPHRSRLRFQRPALWIAIPVFGASVLIVVALSLWPSMPLGLCLGLACARSPSAAFAEYRLARIIASIGEIAAGDRYTSLPELIGDGALRAFGKTAETVRGALIHADTLAVDQRRRETEARLHHAGRQFFTANFRRGVDEVVNAFTSAGERIRGTAARLADSNKEMARQVMESSAAAAQAAEEVAGVADAARDVQALAIDSERQVAEARAATRRTADRACPRRRDHAQSRRSPPAASSR